MSSDAGVTVSREYGIVRLGAKLLPSSDPQSNSFHRTGNTHRV